MAKLDSVSNNWAEVISSIANRPARNTIWSVIQRLVFGAVVYFIWQERNARIVSNSYKSEMELFKIIVDSVRLRLMGLRIKVTPDVTIASSTWNFPIDKNSRYRRIIEDLMDIDKPMEEDIQMMDTEDTNSDYG